MGRETYSIRLGKLRSVAWHQPQRVPQVLHEVLLNHFIPARDVTTQMHEAPGVHTSCRRVAVDQGREHG